MSDQRQTNLDYALAYAAIGWKVLPLWNTDVNGKCRCGSDHIDTSGLPDPTKFGKHPQGNLVTHGHSDATSNLEKIMAWYAEDPNAGVGIACAASGLVVLDIDPRDDGHLTLARIEAEHGVIHSDVVARTQGGGEHRVFKAIPEVTYSGTQGQGLDMKHNGYICVQPTIGGQGIYQWGADANPLCGVEPSPHPTFLRGKERPYYKLTERQGKPVATAQTFEDLRSALEFVDSDEYDDWTKFGLALKPYGEAGYAVWVEWSARSGKFNAAEARRKWDRDLVEPDSVTYLSIFRAAMDAGWKNGGTKLYAADSGETWQELDLGDLALEPVDYLIDDFLARSLMVFVGKPGMGKSTAMIALAAIVAGFRLPDSPLTAPVVGRKIIYITEDTEQLKRNMNALNRNFGISKTEMKAAFVVLPARRVVTKELSSLRNFVERHTVVHECGVVLKPWVIFDTTSASFHLEDENSNAEVAAVMALLKAEFYESMQCSVCMVAHSHKHSTRKDFVADPRGAGAWAGDSTLTSGIFEEDDQRYIMLGKRRYSPPHSEIRIELRTQHETTTDQYGRIQVVELDSTWLDWSSATVRKQSHGSAIGLADAYLDTNVLRFLVNEKLAGRSYSQNALAGARSSIEGCPSRDRIRDIISRLKSSGAIVHQPGRIGVADGWHIEPTTIGIERVNLLLAHATTTPSKFSLAPERAL
jgi:hypothetical protein